LSNSEPVVVAIVGPVVSLVLKVNEIDHNCAREQRAFGAHIEISREIEREIVAIGEHLLHEAGVLARDVADGSRARYHRVGTVTAAV
ncbi:hypothetical protein PFISCL1PPCAC_18393, partial [Pristionchus fissidentatus]